MRFLPPAQFYLVPMSLTVSAVALYPALHHYNVKQISPTATTRGEIETWGKAEVKAQQCLPWSVDLDVESESGGWPTADSGPWFGTLRCNQRRIYYRLAIIFLSPWLLFNFVAMMIGIVAPPTKRKYG